MSNTRSKLTKLANSVNICRNRNIIYIYNGEFDPGSGRTLAACLTHASQLETTACGNGWWRTGE